MFRRIGRKLGLTKEIRTELSDMIYEEGVVSYKNYVPERDTSMLNWTGEGRENNQLIGIALGNPALGESFDGDEKYNICFKGEKIQFIRNSKKLFDFFEQGDKVKIGYKKIHKYRYDYIPPNFDHKQKLNKTTGYSFESIHKIE